MKLRYINVETIGFFHKITEPISRLSLFVIFFWFGILKVIGASPASPLVQALFERTISFMSFDVFIVLFGIFEMLIGVLFILKKYDRIAIPLLFLHMITTFMPLFLVPEATWSGFLIPTLEGQYIIKNLVIIATAINIATYLNFVNKNNMTTDNNI